MKSHLTKGLICLNDDQGFVYKIAVIAYTQWEDESFEYQFKPFYSVIDLLPSRLFQGIPGLDLSTRKAVFERKNRVPTFISERSPGENREDLWQLLERYNMDYLNRLEWLIRTDTYYGGDRLYVKAYEATDEKQVHRCDHLGELGVRSTQILRRLLQIICYGDDLISKDFQVNDQTRGIYYPVLLALYTRESRYILKRKSKGVQEAVSKGHYKGRTPIQIEGPRFLETVQAYKSGQISAQTASQKLGVSRSTFFRRLKRWQGQVKETRRLLGQHGDEGDNHPGDALAAEQSGCDDVPGRG